MKNLLVSSDSQNLNIVEDFLNFNSIKFTSVILWANDLFDISQVDDSDNNILVISISDFINIITVNDSLNLLLFHNHRLVVWEDMDGLLLLLKNLDCLTKLDNMLSDRSNITVVVDGYFDFKFKNIKIKSMPFNKFVRIARKSTVTSTSNPKDFILTMKKSRPHRTLLWKKLIDKNLLDKGFCRYHNPQVKLPYGQGYPCDETWIGEKSNIHNWHDGHPSMDLYNNSFFEIVTETLYSDGYFITEKTTKPISCRMPFLLLSSPGYLKYLQSFGFKTFNGIIDESYDQETDLEKRTDLLVGQVEKIINNGSKNFYLDSKDICEHNYKRLCEISGDWNEKIDQFIFNLLLES